MIVRLLFPALALSILFFLESSSFLTAQDAVISKVYNGGVGRSDSIEILVVRRNLDMRGMILRDFTPEFDDAGGGYRFSQHPLWANLTSGTVIVLASRSTAAPEVSPFTIKVGLINTTYFEPATAGTFDIAVQDMVMLKSSTASFAGLEGNIHSIGVGINVARAFTVSPAFFTFTNNSLNTATPYGLAVLTTSFVFTGNGPDFVRVTSDSGFGGAAYAPVRFGAAHSADHQRLLNQLRGIMTGVRFSPTYVFSDIFPNPAQEVVNVEIAARTRLEQEATISCFTTHGKLINIISVSNINTSTDQEVQIRTYQYPCITLPDGVYFLEVRDKNGFIQRQKFVKIR